MRSGVVGDTLIGSLGGAWNCCVSVAIAVA